MNLEEFYNYKTQLMEDLLTNEEIVNLINPDISVEDSRKLMYTQVFPCEYLPDTVANGKTFLCCDVDIQQKHSSKLIYNPIIYIWIFTHKSLLRLPSGGGVRTDKLAAKICEQINGSFKYGMGELELVSVKRFAPMSEYQGKAMTFSAKDINKVYNPIKDIPQNRRIKQ